MTPPQTPLSATHDWKARSQSTTGRTRAATMSATIPTMRRIQRAREDPRALAAGLLAVVMPRLLLWQADVDPALGLSLRRRPRRPRAGPVPRVRARACRPARRPWTRRGDDLGVSGGRRRGSPRAPFLWRHRPGPCRPGAQDRDQRLLATPGRMAGQREEGAGEAS